MDVLFLLPDFIDAPDQAQLYWLHNEHQGELLSLQDCALKLAQRPVDLVLPAELVTGLLVELPTRKSRWLRQALPFAVEDMLAEEVEHFHLALGELLADGRHRVLAIPRARLTACLHALQEADVRVAALYVDADLLPREGTQALRLGERLLLGGESEARLAVPYSQWPQLQSLCEELRVQEVAGDPYAFLAAGRSKAVNLAQEDFTLNRQRSAWRSWQPVALAALAWVFLQMLVNVGQAWYLERQAKFHADEAVALYRKLFPEDRRIVNLKAQFAEHLSQSAPSSAGMLGMLAPVAQAIAESKSPLTVLQVDFSRDRGDLALQLRAADFPIFEQLRQRLSDEGMQVQLGSASREEQGVTARVVFGGGR